ncbi:MAG: hypothetical protein IPO19_10820 [Rhodoferax sp.]|nr:hypothetical protein [Rhodoferax sp.]
MEINLTEQADVVEQTTTVQGPSGDWNNYYGKGGNDTIRLYFGAAFGGPGADTIEHLVFPGQLWNQVQIGYWDSPRASWWTWAVVMPTMALEPATP